MGHGALDVSVAVRDAAGGEVAAVLSAVAVPLVIFVLQAVLQRLLDA